MSWTKRKIIEQAMVEIGLGNYAFDASAEQLQAALSRLDTMLATWESKGIRLGYPMSEGEGSIDAESGVPDTALEAVYLKLAIALAPSYGKTVSPDTKASARTAYMTLINRNAQMIPTVRNNRNVPVGAGNIGCGPFFADPQDEIQSGPEGILDV